MILFIPNHARLHVFLACFNISMTMPQVTIPSLHDSNYSCIIRFLRINVTHCNTLQHTATHRNTPQHTATHCNTLQPTATGHHLFWDVESCKEMLVAAEIRDVEWATWTCVMGWPAQGIAPKFQGPLGINATARSSFGDTLASADDWGMVSVLQCVAVCCSVLQYVGVRR